MKEENGKIERQKERERARGKPESKYTKEKKCEKIVTYTHALVQDDHSARTLFHIPANELSFHVLFL